MTHTPGPWEVRPGHAEVFGPAIYAPSSHDLEPLAAVDHLSTNPVEDARLIAAAPDLLAAIKAAHSPSAHLGFGIVGTRGDVYVWGTVDYNADRSCAACAAIEKAEGAA